MIEEHIDLPTVDGVMNTFVAYPDEGGPFPVVLFYMDAPGKREELHDMARRLASAGYFVVLPNLYYRHAREYVLKERTEVAMAEMFTLMRSLDPGTTRCDTNSMLQYVDSNPCADSSRIGAVGYCMGGPFVVWAAVDFPDRFRSIASIHGANMATDAPDSPHRVAHKIPCESYFACAEIDRWAPEADIEKLSDALAKAASPHRIEWFPGAHHGFVFPKREGMYDQPSAERHWVRLHQLFDRTLRART